MSIHIVKQGDTIWSIARQYQVPLQRIVNDNGLSKPYTLRVGQALIILIPETIHIAKEGDTVLKIARDYTTTVMSLVQNNLELSTKPYLSVGQPIVISFQGEKLRDITTSGYVYPHVDQQVLLRALPYLTKLTIFGYGFTLQGDLIETNDEELIEFALAFSAEPILLFSSIDESGTFSSERASQLFNNKALQDILIEKIIAKMQEKKYAGIDIDFEFIKPEDRQAYVDFIQNVTTKLNAKGFSVHVDLAPKTSAEQSGLLYEGHDYMQIGAIANTVLIMTYEWGYTYGPPMAVAPINNVRSVVNYAVSEIPKDKIMMGIPNYGYDWTLPYEKGKSKAVTIGNEEAIQIANQYGAKIQYDEISQAPFFKYQDEEGKTHEVWFEDVRSIQAKLNLLAEYDLLGAGYWNLLRPFAQNWVLLNHIFRIKKR